jgi:Ca-activated chloride channel family protein
MFFRNYGTNAFIDTDENHLSTFAMDVDTGSYTLTRSYLEKGTLPPEAAVRVEEFVNYFDYGYAPPASRGDAFAVHLEAAPSRFGPGKVLLRVGMKAREVDAEDRKDAILTFVIDTSGSMEQDGRLELVKQALRLLVDELDAGDRVGIVAFSSTARRVLEPCGADHRDRILDAIDSLHPENSTNVEQGLELGYAMARRAFKNGATNRVILCSDGVANTGTTAPAAILARAEECGKAGITLSSVGVGMGNYNDVLLEQLADKGHGNYAYVDKLGEARRIFSRNLTRTIEVVAKDAKVQVDFNPAVVRASRLIGYENRDVADKDFRNDAARGGDVGAGHSVTALYEVKLWPQKAGRIASVTVRYKKPDAWFAAEIVHAFSTNEVAGRFDDASPSFKLAACAAEFAEILRGSSWAKNNRLSDVLSLARQCEGRRGGRKDVSELVQLIDRACGLRGDRSQAAGDSGVEE